MLEHFAFGTIIFGIIVVIPSIYTWIVHHIQKSVMPKVEPPRK